MTFMGNSHSIRICSQMKSRICLVHKGRRYIKSAIYTILLATLLPMTVLTPIQASAESYLCIAEYVSGFQYHSSTSTWLPVGYESDSEFTISSSSEADFSSVEFTPAWVVQRQGDTGPNMYCEDDFDASGNLNCTWGWRLHFNKNTLRYLMTYEYGYVVNQGDEDEGDSEPHMEIGACSRL